MKIGWKKRLLTISSLTLAFVIGCNGNDGTQNPSVNTGTVPGIPTNIRITPDDSQLTIEWDAVSRATSYNLYIDTMTGVTKFSTSANSGPSFMKHSGVTFPYVHTGLTNGTMYYIVVTAVNSVGESANSVEASGTPAIPVVTWTQLKTGWNVLALAIDPKNPQRVYGTIYDPTVSTNLKFAIVRSTDGGQNWEKRQSSIAANPPPISPIGNGIGVDAGTPSHVYATLSGYLWESLDYGDTWATVLGSGSGGITNVRALAVAPDVVWTGYSTMYSKTNMGILTRESSGLPPGTFVGGIVIHPDYSQNGLVYIGLWYSAGVYKYESTTRTWTAVNTGATTGIHSLAMDSNNPNTLYAGAAGSGVFKTINGGMSWTQITTGLGNQIVLSLAVDPRKGKGETVWTGTNADGLYRTANGGAKWVSVSDVRFRNRDVPALAIDPITGAVYAGTSTGIFKTQ